ncbi:MAG: transcriptional repressor [Proteobacteria bacterium]|nr:transcriptional repressor [Pseudomonadota bacterium]
MTAALSCVAEVIETSTDHPCAHEIHRRVSRSEKIALTTVYRVLSDLVEAGLLTRHMFGDGKARYERAADEARPYLINTATGEIICAEDDGLRALLEEEARRLGYCLVDYRLKLFVAS